MSKNKGWVRLWRIQFNHWVSDNKPWCDGYAWCFIYSRVNHKDGAVNFRNEYIEIKRGEFITSKLKLQRQFGWTYKHVNSFLNSLEKDEMCTIRTTKRYTRIKVLNYANYQPTKKQEHEQKSNQLPNRVRTEFQQGNTNNNDNNYKNVNKPVVSNLKKLMDECPTCQPGITCTEHYYSQTFPSGGKKVQPVSNDEHKKTGLKLFKQKYPKGCKSKMVIIDFIEEYKLKPRYQNRYMTPDLKRVKGVDGQWYDFDGTFQDIKLL